VDEISTAILPPDVLAGVRGCLVHVLVSTESSRGCVELTIKFPREYLLKVENSS
jgi:hypothetical protein